MHTHRVRAAALLATVMVAAGHPAGPAHAADADGHYAIDGVGRATCADYRSAREAGDADYRLFAGWVDGYISAFNHFNDDTYDLTPWQSVELILAKIARYCEAMPEDRFAKALNELAVVLYPDRLKAESAVVQVRVNTQAVFLRQAMLPRIHAALLAAGHAPGDDAEAFTDAMANALKAFQAAEGLAVSGLPDQVTLNALLR